MFDRRAVGDACRRRDRTYRTERRGLTLRGGNIEFHGDGPNERITALRSATIPAAGTREVRRARAATLGDLPGPYGKTWRGTGTGRGGANRRRRRRVRERRPVYPGGCGVTAMWSSRRV